MMQWSQSTTGHAAVNYRDTAVNIGSSIGVRWLLEVVAFEFQPDHRSIMLPDCHLALRYMPNSRCQTVYGAPVI